VQPAVGNGFEHQNKLPVTGCRFPVTAVP
jgi:hypothetical protein